jgi:hypothetical protein
MKRKIKHFQMNSKYIIPIFLALFCLQSCEKISNETDPAKIILGKWRIVEMGNWPTMFPVQETGEYTEYLPDSLKIEYAPDLGYSQKTYWVDSLLHECVYSKAENRCVVSFRLEYEFYNKNQSMRLDFLGPVLTRTFIFKRIK